MFDDDFEESNYDIFCEQLMNRINEAIEMNPESHYYSLRGEIFESVYQNKSMAIADYSIAIAKKSDSLWAYRLRAKAYTDLDNNKAKDDYDKLIKLSSLDHAHFYYTDRGKIKAKLGDYTGALHDFELNQEKRYLRAEDFIFMGDMNVNLKNIDQANFYYKKALQYLLKPGNFSHFHHFIDLLARLKDNNDSIDNIIDQIKTAYNEAIDKYPKRSAFFYCQRGKLYAYCGYYTLAAISVYSALRLDENNLEYKNLLHSYENLRKRNK